MLLFNLEIECDNETFVSAENRTVADILRSLANRLEREDFDLEEELTLRDVNGNRVGLAKYFSEP